MDFPIPLPLESPVTTMLDKIKLYWQTIVGALLVIMTGAFLFEKSKKESAEAIVDNKETLDKVNAITKQIASNDGQLDAEEKKREDLQKAGENAKSSDATDALNKR